MTGDSNDSQPTDDRTLTDYASALGSEAPSPGGGSAAAVTAALAAALGEKVSRFSIAKSYRGWPDQLMSEERDQFARLRGELLKLARDDEAAYAGYARARSLPKSTDRERSKREDKMNAALLAAAGVPLDVAKLALQVLVNLQTLAKQGNRNLISDVSVAGYLAESALRGSVVLVLANTSSLSSDEASAMASLAIRLDRAGREVNAAVHKIVELGW